MRKVPFRARWLAAGLTGMLLLAACTGTGAKDPATPPETAIDTATDTATAEPGSASQPTNTAGPVTPVAAPQQEYDIVTLLPPDAIPAIDDPQFYDVLGAEAEYQPEELVLGVELNGEARAYPIGMLARHEIVNDTVGGQPIAVTY